MEGDGVQGDIYATSQHLWCASIVLVCIFVVFQRVTGPTHPKRGHVVTCGVSHRYKLARSGVATEDVNVTFPHLGDGASVRLFYRRFKAHEEFQSRVLSPQKHDKRVLEGFLPRQPAAGKLEYFLEVSTSHGVQRIPHDMCLVLRFRNPVPAPLLISHVILMFLSMLFGIRTGLTALWAPWDPLFRPILWCTCVCLTGGGMILGPLVQKYAFGALWTGWWIGYDLTDNKTLIMWLGWLIACGGVVLDIFPHALPAVAAGVMTVVYLIPHSMHGSELDYAQIEKGVEAREAIRTGRH